MFRLLWRIYLILSILTLVVWGVDKFLAKAELKRIPERWLYTLAFIGGFPGAMAGMYLFHHKTNIPKFRWVIGGAAILHAASIVIVLARLSWF